MAGYVCLSLIKEMRNAQEFIADKLNGSDRLRKLGINTMIDGWQGKKRKKVESVFTRLRTGTSSGFL